MELGNAPSERARERDITGVKLAGRREHCLARRPLLEKVPEVVLRVIPAVALVLHMRLQQRQRVTSLGADVFERARDRNDIREVRNVGQETTDFRFGIDAGPQASINLEKPMVAEHDGGVWRSRSQ